LNAAISAWQYQSRDGAVEAIALALAEARAEQKERDAVIAEHESNEYIHGNLRVRGKLIAAAIREQDND